MTSFPRSSPAVLSEIPGQRRSRFEYVPASGSSLPSTLLSRVLAFLIPTFLGFYWVMWVADRPAAILLLRPVMLVSSLGLVLLLSHLPVTRAERSLFVTLAILCSMLLVPSLAATDPVRALREWIKLLVVCAVSLMLCRALRYPRTSKAFGVALIIGSIVTGILIITIYVENVGMVLPTYTATRILKGTMLRAEISLNSMAFYCTFAYVCGMCLVRRTRLLWVAGLLLLICSTLTGSRAPVAVFVLSGLTLLAINALRSRRSIVFGAGLTLAASMIVGLVLAIALPDSRDLSAFTEGRWDLWSVAVHKFSERPILGYGYQSVQDDSTFIPGGYHNVFLTAAAEQGVVGAAPVVYLYWVLLCYCWKLAFRRPQTWRNGQWALVGFLLLLIVATIEVGGLFGSAQGPGDFLAYIFLAIVVSRFSQEEDYIRSTARHKTLAVW